MDPNWRARARCGTTDAEGMFQPGAEQRRTKAVCRTCPVRTECLAHALDQGIDDGMWGGMTERERRALVRRRPEVTDWAGLLDAAREQFEGRRAPQRSHRVMNGRHDRGSCVG